MRPAPSKRPALKCVGQSPGCVGSVGLPQARALPRSGVLCGSAAASSHTQKACPLANLRRRLTRLTGSSSRKRPAACSAQTLHGACCTKAHRPLRRGQTSPAVGECRRRDPGRRPLPPVTAGNSCEFGTAASQKAGRVRQKACWVEAIHLAAASCAGRHWGRVGEASRHAFRNAASFSPRDLCPLLAVLCMLSPPRPAGDAMRTVPLLWGVGERGRGSLPPRVGCSARFRCFPQV